MVETMSGLRERPALAFCACASPSPSHTGGVGTAGGARTHSHAHLHTGDSYLTTDVTSDLYHDTGLKAKPSGFDILR